MSRDIQTYIDHTLLRPDATRQDIDRVFEEANHHIFRAVCVAPSWLDEKRILTGPRVATVIGFPHGNVTVATKMSQIKSCGADEFDVVANIGDVKSGRWKDVEFEIMSLRRSTPNTIKYIVEVGYLTDEELFKIADLLIEHKIEFIKTCTGYGPRNVTVDDIKKIKAHVGSRIYIKASGGIKTRAFAEDLIAAGADRLGTSSGVQIVTGEPVSTASY